METITYTKFKKAVDDKLNNFQFPCNDPYILQKYKDGFFDNELEAYEQDENEVFLSFKENYSKIISPLVQVFPSYYK